MTGPAVEPVGAIRAGLGEGPVWDSKRNLLLWIDIRLSRLYTTDIQTAATTFCDLPGSPGCVALTRDGEVLLAIGQELFVLSKDSEVRRITVLSAGALGWFNDGKPVLGRDGDGGRAFWLLPLAV
jgi:sugar lactone lactonase YvrE